MAHQSGPPRRPLVEPFIDGWSASKIWSGEQDNCRQPVGYIVARCHACLPTSQPLRCLFLAHRPHDCDLRDLFATRDGLTRLPRVHRIRAGSDEFPEVTSRQSQPRAMRPEALGDEANPRPVGARDMRMRSPALRGATQKQVDLTLQVRDLAFQRGDVMAVLGGRFLGADGLATGFFAR